MAEIEGQEPASPPGETETGQEQQAVTPPVDETQAIIDAASKAGEPAAPEDETGTEEAGTETEEKPAPYDQDPKWLAARQAEKNLQEILNENDIEDVEELKTMLNSGLKLSEILGDRDAQQLITDADTLKNYNEYWAEQKRLKEEETLDPDERADKYKKELDDFKQEQAAKESAHEQVEGAKDAIKGFNDRVEGVIETEGFDEGTAEIAKMFLGVNNPFNEVDIFDKKAVGSMAADGIEKFKAFVANVRQQAIDEYAAGKSGLTPITTTETPDKATVVTKKSIDPNLSVDEVFAQARDELLEAIGGGTSV
jgi:hypothetical protein